MELKLRAEDVLRFTKGKKPKGLCRVFRCKNRAGPGGQVCRKHTQQLWRLRNPTRAAFRALRDHARARKVSFTLEFIDFEQLVQKTRYVTDDGKRVGGLHVDRIDTKRGYEKGNVQLLEVSEHSRKSNRERWSGYTYTPPTDTDNCPF